MRILTQESNSVSQNIGGRIFRNKPVLKIGFVFTIAFLAGFGMYLFQIHDLALEYSKKIISGVDLFFVEFSAQVGDSLEEEINLYKSNGLKTIYIDLPFKSEQAINNKKVEAIETGILFSSDEDYVSAQISFLDEEKIDIDLRLKGDWTDHLEGEKLSFRIHVKDDNQINGMTRFSIQAPETRTFINEWLFHENLMKEGVLTTRYDFVNVLINGKYKGVYALEESFAEELIESQTRRQGVILRFDEDLMWRNIAAFYVENEIARGDILVTNIWSADISYFREGHISSNPNLSQQAETAVEILYSFQKGDVQASEVFDVQLMGRFFALCDLWQAKHAVAWHNLRFYYNPISGLLEPVVFDGNPFSEGDAMETYSEFLENPIFMDPIIHKFYLKELSRITLTDYIQDIENEFSAPSKVYQTALNKDYDHVDLFGYGVGVGFPWIMLEKRAEFLRRAIGN